MRCSDQTSCSWELEVVESQAYFIHSTFSLLKKNCLPSNESVNDLNKEIVEQFSRLFLYCSLEAPAFLYLYMYLTHHAYILHCLLIEPRCSSHSLLLTSNLLFCLIKILSLRWFLIILSNKRNLLKPFAYYMKKSHPTKSLWIQLT